VLSSLGVAHDRNAQYDEALACHYEAFMLANSLNDHDLQGHALINLGLHYAREDRTKAELCHERAVDIARKAGNPDLEANALVELGVVMAARGDSTSARDTWTNAMALAVGIGARHIEKRVHHLLAELPESE
jgi:tetratricopeptide (TPR) repeat protein